MSNILFPPAGAHPAAYPLTASIAPRAPSAPAIAPVAQSGASGFSFTPDRGPETARQPRPQSKEDDRSAPPTLLQIKIDSMLREQAEARSEEPQTGSAKTAAPDPQPSASAMIYGRDAQSKMTAEDPDSAESNEQGQPDENTDVEQRYSPSDSRSLSTVFNTLP